MAENQITDGGATMSDVEHARAVLTEARGKGALAKLGAFVKLSGPGWLQSAITLGGGSLASSLYLGVLGGFALLWLQPLAMIIGIIMLSAIGYVTLSTGERPFKAIKEHVNPVLGWGWILATLMANCVWALPQFGLAFGSMSQNLMPGTFGEGAMDPDQAKWIVSGSIAVLCIIIVLCYDGGGKAVKFFDILLKAMVAIIVVSFFGVVVYMSVKGELNWDKIGNGLIPDYRLFYTPASSFDGPLAAVGASVQGFWTTMIVNSQRDVLVAAAATAVGINMTFLLPYSMLKRGWNKDFRGLAVFDLSTGLFIPFILATGCVVIASASQFHTVPAVPFAAEDAAIAIAAADSPDAEKVEELVGAAYGDWLIDEGKEAFVKDASAKVLAEVTDAHFAQHTAQEKHSHLAALLNKAAEGKMRKVNKKLVGAYKGLALKRAAESKTYAADLKALTKQLGDEGKAKDAIVAGLPLADRKIAAMLVKRDSIDLARALSPLTGDVVANYVFGIGVVGMAISSIIILMLINGFTVCEIFDKPSHGWLYRFGCLIPAVGILGPFIWSQAAPYLAIPTSVIAFMVIPIAYATFALLLNQRKLLGDSMPPFLLRWIWNLLMFVGVVAVTIGSVFMAYKKTQGLPGIWGGGWVGLAGVGVFILLVIIAQIKMKKVPIGEPVPEE